jgi:hypothetical protein
MPPIPNRLTLRSSWWRSCRRFHFIRRDAAIAVPVEAQDELTRLADELVAGDLAVLIFVKIAEVCIRQGGIRPADCCELGRVEMPVAVAISQRKHPVEMALPFVAGIDTVVIGVPYLRPILEGGPLAWPGGSGLGEGERDACQEQAYRNADPVNGFCVRQISLLALLPTAPAFAPSGEKELYRFSSAGGAVPRDILTDLAAPCAASAIGNRYRLAVHLIVTK